MTIEVSESLTTKAAQLFLLHDGDESDIKRALVREGLSDLDARMLHAFVQTAFGWALLEKMGVTNIPSRLQFVDGKSSFSVSIRTQQMFSTALSLAKSVLTNGYTKEISKEVFTAVISGSVEVGAVSKALDAGKDISGATVDTVFMRFSRRDLGLDAPRKWWAIWRK